MVAVTVCLSLILALDISASVLNSVAVLPPDGFKPTSSHRTLRRLVGGHMKLNGDHTQNSISSNEKQRPWDDGMLLSSAGDGEQKKKAKEEDEDKKTLSDQVSEGKYGLIQNELFEKKPSRPGVLSYTNIPETQKHDNLHTLGGLSKDEIWLAEDQLLVLKGGFYPDKTDTDNDAKWPPIDDYNAPKRQVKLPQKPLIPPPFPVRLSDDGPLVFLTPNGSVPAPDLPPYPPYDRPTADNIYPPSPQDSGPPSNNPGDVAPGFEPFPNAPFSHSPAGNASSPFGFPTPINGSLTDSLPPGAAILPPPNNLNDPYDEDDPSIYYPPPYSFSYTVDNKSAEAAGPLVPGIVLPPPPDFFGPLEENTTTTRTSTAKFEHKRPLTGTEIKTRRLNKQRNNTKTKPLHTILNDVTYDTPNIVHIPSKQPTKIVLESITLKPTEKATTFKVSKQKPVSHSPTYPVGVLYDYQEPKLPTSTASPYIIFDLPSKQTSVYENNYITSTSVPLREFYTSKPAVEIEKQHIKEVFNKPLDNSLASFYFYEEVPKPTPAPHQVPEYYNTVRQNHQPNYHNNPQSGFIPSYNVNYRPNDAILLWPQKQGPRTLTQEYFSVQNAPLTKTYQQPRPNFYEELTNIQHAIDYYSANKAKPYQKHTYKLKHATPKPVYQFSFQPDRSPSAFHAPTPDTEPFRPMVSYSKPLLNLEPINVTPNTHQQYLVESPKVSTVTPTSKKYYPKSHGSEDYEDIQTAKHQKLVESTTKAPRKVVHSQYPITPNPLHHTYFTKQDERYFDDITRNYFNIFGKKIENEAGSLASTPPSQPLDISPIRNPVDNSINIIYEDEGYRRQQHLSLDGDTNVNYNNPPGLNPDAEVFHPLDKDTDVNYQNPRPTINPDAEFLPITNPAYRKHRPQVIAHFDSRRRPNYGESENLLFPIRHPNLNADTRVNYKSPLPPINPDAEIIGEGRPGTFVSYRLPGDGAHVYFVTPRRSRERGPR